MASQQKQRRQLNQNIRLPLIGSFTNRESGGTKDQRFLNIFPETRKVESIESTKIFLNKRPGISQHRAAVSGAGRGLTYFNGNFYYVIDNKLYKDGVTPTALITLTTSTGKVGLQLGNSATIGDYLFVCDGIGGWVIKDDDTVLTISNTSIMYISIDNVGSGYTDGTYACSFSGGGGAGLAANYIIVDGSVSEITITNAGSGYTSAPTVSFPSGGGTAAAGTAFLNAFPTPHVPIPTFIDGYILIAKGSDVYNCVLDEPQNWDASNFLSAEMFPDPVVGLARQNNQVVVFGENSVEFFYDAANTSGSPMSRTDAAIIQMGCAFPKAIYQNEKYFIFVAQSDSGGRAAWITDGYQPKKISDAYIERILDAETNPTGCIGFGLRTMGHLFYLVNLPTLNRTLVYDVNEKLWHEWSTTSGGNQVAFDYIDAADNYSGKMYIQKTSTGAIHYLDPTVYTDLGTLIKVQIVTNKYDMDTYFRKFMSSFKLVGDRYLAATNNSVILNWSDDDYQTWSNDKEIKLIDDFPNFARLGSFRRRAFRITHEQNNPLRVESMDITYTEGVN